MHRLSKHVYFLATCSATSISARVTETVAPSTLGRLNGIFDYYTLPLHIGSHISLEAAAYTQWLVEALHPPCCPPSSTLITSTARRHREKSTTCLRLSTAAVRAHPAAGFPLHAWICSGLPCWTRRVVHCKRPPRLHRRRPAQPVPGRGLVTKVKNSRTAMKMSKAKESRSCSSR